MIYTTINASQIDDYVENDKDVYVIDKKEKIMRHLNNLSFYKVHEMIKYTETTKDGRYEFFIEE